MTSLNIENNDDTTSTSIATAAQMAGAIDGGLAIVQTADGEMTLAPAVDAEFSNASMPAGWASSVTAAGGGTAVSSGNAIVNGATLLGPAGSGMPRALDVTATLTAPSQAIGLGAGSLASPLAVFVVKSDGLLYIRTIGPSTTGAIVTKETAVTGSWLGASQVFHIDWSAANVAYKIDGTAVGTHTGLQWGAVGMAPMILDGAAGDGAVTVDWIRLSPYAASGTFSKVFDAGAVAAWTKLATSATVPTGAAVSVSYRTGNTPTPDASWTAFTTMTGTGGTLTGSGQYLELRLQLSTTNSIKTPVVNDFTLTYKLQ